MKTIRLFTLFFLTAALLLCLAGAAGAEEDLPVFHPEDIVWTEDAEHLTDDARYGLKYSGTAEYLVVPSSIDGNPLTVIGTGRDGYSGLLSGDACSTVKAIRISEGITSLERNALCDALEVRYVELPNTLKSIKAGAFSRCFNLTELTIPASVTYISPDAFPTFSYWPLLHVWPGSEAELYCIRNGVMFDYVPESGATAPVYAVGTDFSPIDESHVYVRMPNGTKVAFPRKTTLWDGIDVLIDQGEAAPDAGYYIQLRLKGTYPDPQARADDPIRRTFADHYFTIFLKNRNNIFTAWRKEYDVYNKRNRQFKEGFGYSWTGQVRDGKGRTHIHLDTMGTRCMGSETSWTLEVLYGDGEDAPVIGEMTVSRRPEGIETVAREELQGGWKLISAPAGDSWDDMFIMENQVIFRRHDAGGNPYYAPRQITGSSESTVTGVSFRWYIFRNGDEYIFRDERGHCASYRKTEETEDDFRMTEMTASTPPCAALFSRDWHPEDEFGVNLYSAYYFFEDTVGSAGRDSKITNLFNIRYDGYHFTWYNSAGEVYYEGDWTLTGGGSRGWLKTGNERYAWQGQKGKDTLLLPVSADAPADAVPAEAPPAAAEPASVPADETSEPDRAPEDIMIESVSSPAEEPAAQAEKDTQAAAMQAEENTQTAEEVSGDRIRLWNDSVQIELGSDGTGHVTEILPEGNEEQDVRWTLDGNTLRIAGLSLYGFSAEIQLTGNPAAVEIGGEPVSVFLPDTLPDSIRARFEGGSADSGTPDAGSGSFELPDLPPETLPPADEPAAADIQPEELNGPAAGNTAAGSSNEAVAEVPAQGETPESAPEPVPVQLTEPIPGRSGVSRITVTGVDATSWIKGKDPKAYAPQSMIDGNETTSFQFSTKTTKPGKEYLYFEFAGPATVDQLWIKNGFWKITEGYDQYVRNCRVKKMTIEYRYEGSDDYKDPKSISLKDDKKRKDWTVVELKRHEHVTGVRILIQAIYKGTKFKTDVCISEIMFVEKNN